MLERNGSDGGFDGKYLVVVNESLLMKAAIAMANAVLERKADWENVSDSSNHPFAQA